MKYLIVGTGFTGLVAALDLVEAGHEVVMLEKNSFVGGLAAGFKETKWEWNLEHHYHHIFRNDKSIINLANRLNVKVKFYRVKTSFWDGEKIFQFDSVKSVLTNQQISLVDRIRTLGTMGFLKMIPNWEWFERMTSEQLIKMTMGRKVWDKIWGPLFLGKFHQWTSVVNATWFWARIHARSQALGYFGGGFNSLVKALTDKLISYGVKINLNENVEKIKIVDDKAWVKTQKETYRVDKVLVTGPSNVVKKIMPDEEITNKPIQSLGAITMILETRKKFLDDNTYWLNISDSKAPFLAFVEHTNMIGKEKYDNKNILYLGNYLPKEHAYFGKSDKDLLKIYAPYLKKINRKFDVDDTNNVWVFKTDYAQSVFEINHGRDVPKMEIVKNKIYWCGIEHVYPWDRGTNYAVEWGHKVAKLMMNKVR